MQFTGEVLPLAVPDADHFAGQLSHPAHFLDGISEQFAEAFVHPDEPAGNRFDQRHTNSGLFEYSPKSSFGCREFFLETLPFGNGAANTMDVTVTREIKTCSINID